MSLNGSFIILLIFSATAFSITDTLANFSFINAAEHTINPIVTVFKTICNLQGVELDKIAFENEFSACVQSVNRVYKLTNQSVSDKELKSIETDFLKSNGFVEGIDEDVKVTLMEKTIPNACKVAQAIQACTNPLNYKTMGKCLDENTTETAQITYGYADLVLKTICKEDGKKILSLLENGFFGCLKQYKKIQKCLREGVFEALEAKVEKQEIILSSDETCQYFDKFNNCVMDFGEVNQVCSKKVMDIFREIITEFKRWTDQTCFGVISGSNGIVGSFSQVTLTFLAMVLGLMGKLLN